MIQPEVAVALSLWLSGPDHALPDEGRFHLVVTGATETSLPAGVAPTALLEMGTGSLTVAPEPGELVRSASKYLHALAVLPINPEHDDLVDRLVEERVAGTSKKRPLPRR